jgi:hypothetical protein
MGPPLTGQTNSALLRVLPSSPNRPALRRGCHSRSSCP